MVLGPGVMNLASIVANFRSTVVFKLLMTSNRRCPSLKIGTFGMRAIIVHGKQY